MTTWKKDSVLIPTFSCDKAYKTGRELYWVNEEAFSLPCYMPLTTAGYPLAHTRAGQTKITTESIHIIGNRVKQGILELESLSELEAFVNRRDISTGEGDSEQVIVSFQGYFIGHGIISRGLLLSRFPRIGWEFQLTIDDFVAGNFQFSAPEGRLSGKPEKYRS